MCKSVRGAAFFGSSLHLALSFVFLFWFIFDTLINEINIALWKCEPPEQKFRDIDPLAHYLNIVFKLLYFIGLCVTGIYIFRGVERERPQLLKYATLAFVILQILGVIFFSIFFSIQWNTEPDPIPSPSLPETARLIASEDSVVASIDPEPKSLCQASCPNANGASSPVIPTDLNQLNTVITTPIVSENVLPAPELDLPATTTPIPASGISNGVVVEVNNSTDTKPTPPSPATTTTTTASTQAPAPPPCSVTGDCPPSSSQVPEPRRRLPHNQLVSLVLQMCLAVTNGLGSVAYVIVLALYMVKL